MVPEHHRRVGVDGPTRVIDETLSGVAVDIVLNDISAPIGIISWNKVPM